MRPGNKACKKAVVINSICHSCYWIKLTFSFAEQWKFQIKLNIFWHTKLEARESNTERQIHDKYIFYITGTWIELHGVNSLNSEMKKQIRLTAKGWFRLILYFQIRIHVKSLTIMEILMIAWTLALLQSRNTTLKMLTYLHLSVVDSENKLRGDLGKSQLTSLRPHVPFVATFLWMWYDCQGTS